MVLSKQQALVTLRWNTTPKLLSNGSLEYHILKHASVFKEGQILYIILYHFLYFYDKVENWGLVVSNTL